MSIIFGIANLDHAPVENAALLSMAERTAAHAPDGTFINVDGPVGMGFQPYHTTVSSRLEKQPLSDARGNIIVFDGRLDNRLELAHLLSLGGESIADSSVVLAAFNRWGEACFNRFIGDWSLALWSARQRILYLARDHAGTRTLYYQFRDRRVVWSTYLETFLGPNETPPLDQEFSARYLAALPLRNSTPYQGVRLVPPAHVLRFGDHAVRSTMHWSWLAKDKLSYKSPEEYDEHFLACFERSIRRRDLAGAPILAELSGGMDSTGIVCASDWIRKEVSPEGDLLDTVSLYDNSEPDWNELPYLTATENYRGKTGIHIATSYLDRSLALDKVEHVFPWPGYDSNARQREEHYEHEVAAGGYRVILSGVGGDELLGGVATPYPELADYLVSFRVRRLLRRTTEWSLSNRETFARTLLQTLQFTFNLYQHPIFDAKSVMPWVSPGVRKLCFEIALEEEKQYRWLNSLPSSLNIGRNWLSILETLPHLYPKNTIRREYRYPYLDRELVEYLQRVPREQLVHPGRRRAMMRRALTSIMPKEIIERRRKAFLGRGPYALLQKEEANITQLLSNSYLEALGLVDIGVVKATLRTTISGVDTGLSMPLLRLIALELWLRGSEGRHIGANRASAFPAKRWTQHTEANGIPMARTEG